MIDFVGVEPEPENQGFQITSVSESSEGSEEEPETVETTTESEQSTGGKTVKISFKERIDQFVEDYQAWLVSASAGVIVTGELYRWAR